MCFSAEASFGAAAALVAIGALSVQGAPTRAHLPLAAVPLLFAAQQACEGTVWLVLERNPLGRSDSNLLRVYLFFALFLWPAYLPPALLLLEKEKPRKLALALFWTSGTILGAYLMACAASHNADACIAFGNLYYWVQIDAPFKGVVPYAYAMVIVASLLASSIPGTSLLAACVVVSFAVTGWLYRAGFISVWCFVAAMLGGVVAGAVRFGATRARDRQLDSTTARH